MAESLNRVKDWRDRGYYLRTPPLTILSYDPAADGADNDALVILTREEHQRGEPYDPDFAVQTMFRIVGASRMRPDFEFPDKVAHVLRIHKNMNAWRRTGRSAGSLIIVEANGIGYGMAATLKDKLADKVIAYKTIGSTSNSAFAQSGIVMPRLPGLSHLKMLMEQHYVRAATGAPGLDELQREMNAFVWAGPKRPEALPGQHDDMVMSLAGGVWVGTKVVPPLLKQQTYNRRAS